MKKIYELLGLAILIFASWPTSIVAQPVLKGCHYVLLDAPLQPLSPAQRQAIRQSEERSDTIDILHYDIDLEVVNFWNGIISSTCEVRFTPKMNEVEGITLDLLDFNINQVRLEGNPTDYNFDGRFLVVDFDAPANIGDTLTVAIDYAGLPTTDDSGFGGLDFTPDYGYNLGIGLSSNPYNFGRSWFPCFDNFVERATYTIHLTTSLPQRGYAIGVFLGEEEVTTSKRRRSYEMDQLLPTYLVGIAVANYHDNKSVHNGLFGEVPISLLSKPQDSTAMRETFTYLGDCIDAFEYWFGPYSWGQVGFVNTSVGAMEHATLIAYPDFVGTGGPTFSNNRVMAHELAHHWWGNVISPNHPSEMWFKEGNAEYSAHLFTEWTFGYAAFIDQVRTNHYDLLRNLHVREGYLALSGMSYENTYSDHTYYRGASMIHNLRGYLGDSLFRSGMTQFLAESPYTATDAINFRDRLSALTGYDLTSYFQDWILSPGYSGYAIDSLVVQPNGSEYRVQVYVEQGRRGAPDYHTGVPLDIAFYDATGDQRAVREITANGRYSNGQVTLPFEPAFYLIDEDNRLLLANSTGRAEVTETGTLSIPYTGMIFDVEQVDQPTDLFINYHWIGADDTDSPDSRTSSRRFWRIDGQFPEGFKLSTSLFYNANNPANDWEYDLANVTEDSLIIAYRPDASFEWTEYPFYSKNILVNNADGRGVMNIDSLIPGDYVFANGPIFPVSTQTPQVEEIHFGISPNPSSGAVQLRGDLADAGDLSFEVYDVSGRLVDRLETELPAGDFTLDHDFSILRNGLYVVRALDEKGRKIGVQQLEILK